GSRDINPGCERRWRFGGSPSCSEWQPTVAGTWRRSNPISFAAQGSQRVEGTLVGLGPEVAAVQAQAVGKAATGGEDGPGENADPVLQGTAVHVDGVGPMRQLHPEHVAARGSADAGAVGKIAGGGVADPRHLAGQGQAEAAEVTIVAAGVEELGGRH